MATRPRAQQPQDSPGASLPTETLLEILKLSLVELAPSARQAAVFAYQRVCLQWHAVATDLATRQLFVANSQQADRLASVLRSNAEKQEGLRRVAIEVEKWTGAGGRGQRVACVAGLHEARATPAHSRRLARREEEQSGFSRLRLTMLTGHSKLRVLIAPTLVLKNPSGQANAYGRLTNQLEHLQISSPGYYGYQMPVVIGLIQSAIATLSTLRVGNVGHAGPQIVSAVQPAASRLVELDIVGEIGYSPSLRGYMEEFLPALASIRSLTIGYDSLQDLGQLFEFLSLLTTLEHFTLKLTLARNSLYPTLSAIKPAAVSDYLTSATKLKSLTLPLSLEKNGWTTEEVSAVERTASLAGITFQLLDLRSLRS